jgi:HlyD family secretion protein
MKMKKYFIGLIVLGCAMVVTFVFLIVKAAGPKTVYPVETVTRQTIEEKVIASGSILPEKQVEVKSSLSGVVDELFADPGAPIRKGDPLLSIRVVASSLELNSSEAALGKATIRLRTAQSERDKAKLLFDNEMIAKVEFENAETTLQLAMEDYKEAQNRIALIKEGVSSGKRTINNLVRSPITGTVLDIPVKQGAPIQESGSYAVGTTVALIADMNSLLFEGDIDEGQIDSLKKGMEAKIKLAAIDTGLIPGKLSFLSPRGVESSGSIKFKIRISFQPPRDMYLRAGYSASAEIILKKAENVVCVRERDLVMADGHYFAEVEKAPQSFVKTEVKLGLSDGLFTEVKSGLSAGDKIKSLKGQIAP